MNLTLDVFKGLVLLFLLVLLLMFSLPRPSSQSVLAAPALISPAVSLAANGDASLSGTGEPGSQVQVVANGEVLGQTEVQEDGTWSLTTKLDQPEQTEIELQTLDDNGEVVATSDPIELNVTQDRSNTADDGANSDSKTSADKAEDASSDSQSTDDQTTSTESDNQSTDGEATSAESDSQSADDEATNADSDSQSTDDEATSAESDSQSADDQATSAESDNQSTDDEAASTDSDSQSADDEATNAESDSQSADDEAANADSDSQSAGDEATSAESDSQSADDELANAESDSQSADDEATSAESDSQSADDEAASSESDSQSADDEATSAESDNQSTDDEANSSDSNRQNADDEAASTESDSQSADDEATSADSDSQSADDEATSADSDSQSADDEATSAESDSQSADEVVSSESEVEITLEVPTLLLTGVDLAGNEATFIGTGDVGSDVELLVDGEIVGKGKIDQDGTWGLSIELEQQDEVEVQALMVTNNEVVAISEKIFLNLATSTTEIDLPFLISPSIISTGNATFTGIGTADAQLQLVINGQAIGQTQIEQDGTWSLSTLLEEAGEIEVQVQLIDAEEQVIVTTEPITLTVTEAVDE